MALGDGDTWDETTPTDATLVVNVDDYERDIRKGVRSRMAFEHEWPASQAATAEGGKHKFITLQNQAAKPTIAGTQLAAVYSKTVGSGLQELFFENEAGTEVQLSNRTGLNAGAVIAVHTGVAKAWAVFSGTATGSNAPTLGYNISAVTRHSAGNYTAVFTTAFSSTNYVVSGLIRQSRTTPGLDGGHIEVCGITGPTTTSCRFVTGRAMTEALADYPTVHIQFIGLQ